MNPFEIPYFGSFQRGQIFRSGDPLNMVWRHIERAGTIDNLNRITTSREFDKAKARHASLRIKQAVEFRKASKNTSTLTKPLLLYYAALNLCRGLLFASHGDLGNPSHGLRFIAGETPLDCSAKTVKDGTFVQISKLFGVDLQLLQASNITLRDALASIPELVSDFHLLNSGPSSTACVSVKAFIRGKMLLRYHVPSIQQDEFSKNWQKYLPWMKDNCEYIEPYTLQLKSFPKDENEIELFCYKHLLHDLNFREDAVWFDHIVRSDVVILPRITAYLAALFILSNMSRYEPELLDDAVREPTDFAYVISTFLDNAERYFPQLILESMYGNCMFFK